MLLGAPTGLPWVCCDDVDGNWSLLQVQLAQGGEPEQVLDLRRKRTGWTQQSGLEQPRPWPGSWITSAGPSGSASTGESGGTRWRRWQLGFWWVDFVSQN